MGKLAVYRALYGIHEYRRHLKVIGSDLYMRDGAIA
jgi:hypothetical protein